MTFNEAIKELNSLRRNDKHIAVVYQNGCKDYTSEYNLLLDLAYELKPTTTPIGFYLD